MTRVDLAQRIDHTELRPEATPARIVALCEEAILHGLFAVCVAPVHVALAGQTLEGRAPTRVATVIGFPHGDAMPEVKRFEAARAFAAGAHEVDMVIAVGLLKGGERSRVQDDIAGVVAAAREVPGRIVKVILETALLTQDEKRLGCELVVRAGADFVKTSTGFAASGATAGDVALFRSVVGDALGIKAAGGIRDLVTARAMLDAGATRLGASASVRILSELP